MLRDNDPISLLMLKANAEKLQKLKLQAQITDTSCSLEGDLQQLYFIIDEIKSAMHAAKDEKKKERKS